MYEKLDNCRQEEHSTGCRVKKNLPLHYMTASGHQVPVAQGECRVKPQHLPAKPQVPPIAHEDAAKRLPPVHDGHEVLIVPAGILRDALCPEHQAVGAAFLHLVHVWCLFGSRHKLPVDYRAAVRFLLDHLLNRHATGSLGSLRLPVPAVSQIGSRFVANFGRRHKR